MAAGDLTTIEKVRAYCRLEDPIDDTWLGQLISSSSAWFLSQLGRPVLATSVVELQSASGYVFPNSLPGTRSWRVAVAASGRTRVLLKKCPPTPDTPPVTVSQVKIDDEVIPARTTTDSSGWEFRDFGIDIVGYVFTGTQRIEVSYTAGYATVPADLEQAVIEHVNLRYRDRDWGPMTYKYVGGDVVDRRGELSGSLSYINGVLDRYRALGVA